MTRASKEARATADKAYEMLEAEHLQGKHKANVMVSINGIDCPLCEHESEVSKIARIASDQSKYLTFDIPEVKERTVVCSVMSKSSGDILGTIKWYGAWRQYTFFPETKTVFNTGCMNEIVFVINQFMKVWKESDKQKYQSLDTCAMHGIESHMIDNYPEWYIRRLIEAFERENQ